ncbi:MAG TPA: site-specific integrase [Terriglobia bacterium]|nr:site-specific integrase [Terriglobia bacterium]
MRGVYKDPKKPGVYCIHYYDHLHKRHRERVGPYDAAVTLYHKRKTECLLDKKLPQLGRHEIKFDEIAAECLAYCERHHRWPKKDLERLQTIEGEFGKRAAATIQPREIDTWLRSLGVAPATENRYKALMSLAYRLALQEGKVSVNPARLVPNRYENNVRVRWLTPDEESKLFDVAERHYRHKASIARFGMHTGLRRSEQASLTWADVDWHNRQVNIQRSKNGRSRSVPLNSDALLILSAAKLKSEAIATRRHDGRTVSLDARIFKMGSRADDGRERWLTRAAELAGIPHFTWHDLRHTFASRLRMKGVDLSVIKELLGHTTITTTERYAHISPSFHSDAVQKLVDFGQLTTTAGPDPKGTGASE